MDGTYLWTASSRHKAYTLDLAARYLYNSLTCKAYTGNQAHWRANVLIRTTEAPMGTHPPTWPTGFQSVSPSADPAAPDL